MRSINSVRAMLVITGGIALGLVSGCSSADVDALDSDPTSEVVGTDQPEIWRASWGPTEWAPQVVGMTLQTMSSPAKIYTWYNDGWVCRGDVGLGSIDPTDVCDDAMYQYTAPDGNFSAIRGVGIARNTHRMYAWYDDSTFTRGTSDNLTAYYGKYSFSRPAKPGGGTFAMNDLIEVDNSPNGQWYFYWKVANGTGTVYRTTGTSDDGDAYSQAVAVTVASNHGYIVGIGFNEWYDCPDDCTHHSPIVTWYSDGFLNESTTSLNLAQQ